MAAPETWPLAEEIVELEVDILGIYILRRLAKKAGARVSGRQ